MTTQEIINTIANGSISKGQLIEIAYSEKNPSGIDPALPLPVLDELRENGINTGFMVYDCAENKPVHLLEKIFSRLFELNHFECLTILEEIHDIYREYDKSGR
jgi:hypothetical protein